MRNASNSEAAQADRFLADLLGEPLPAMRDHWRRSRPSMARVPESTFEDLAEIIEVSGFFGPNNVRRTEQQVRDGIVTRANAEWAAWHNTAGHARPEGDAGMFGRLVGYYAAAVGRLKPDTLTSVQAAALGANYTRLLASGQTAAAIAAESRRLAGTLLTGAADATVASVVTHVSTAIVRAREAHVNRGEFSAWSAAFVTACVRGVAISDGLEAVIGAGRDHIGRDVLLEASLTHAGYTIEARRRRAATMPRRRGTYHAFTPRERAPQIADLIVQDRSAGTVAQVATLSGLATGLLTHGDIVVEVQPDFVVTIGGNVGDSVRRRRYPRDPDGLLVVDRRQLFTQETNTGTLPPVPARTAQTLALLSTGRIFALLTPVEEQAAVPGQPYGGGVLT